MATSNKKDKKKAAKKVASTTSRSAPKKQPKVPAAKKAAFKRVGNTVGTSTANRRAAVITRGGPPAAVAAAAVVVLNISFSGVDAGNSSITATCNGEESSRTSGGSITFSGVNKDDVIQIDGSSPGTTRIDISVAATPERMEFSPGNFNDVFIIN